MLFEHTLLVLQQEIPHTRNLVENPVLWAVEDPAGINRAHTIAWRLALERVQPLRQHAVPEQVMAQRTAVLYWLQSHQPISPAFCDGLLRSLQHIDMNQQRLSTLVFHHSLLVD